MTTFVTPRFIAGALVLLVAALAMRPTLAALETRYTKLPIECQKPLSTFTEDDLPRFRLADPDCGLGLDSGDFETDVYITQPFDPDLPADEAEAADEVMLFATYYSNPRDRIPHTPEVCGRQSGAVIDEMRIERYDIPGLGPTDFRFLDIDYGRGSRAVMLYLFICNGKAYSDRESVRLAMGWPGDRYVYFSKIEAVTRCPPGQDPTTAIARCRMMMEDALPVLLEEYYPTRAMVAGE